MAVAAALAGCGSNTDSDAVKNGLRGSITVLTDRAHYPFFQAAAEQFQTDEPNVTILVRQRRGRVRYEGDRQAIKEFSKFVTEHRDGISAATAVVEK